MTAQPDELDAHARTLEAERARPMARWSMAAPAVATEDQRIEERRSVAREIARSGSKAAAS